MILDKHFRTLQIIAVLRRGDDFRGGPARCYCALVAYDALVADICATASIFEPSTDVPLASSRRTHADISIAGERSSNDDYNPNPEDFH